MAVNSLDTKLYYQIAATPTYAELTGLYETPDIYGKPEKIDITVLTDTVKKSILGISDPGELAFKFNYDNSSATANFRVLKGLETARTVATFKLELSDGTTVEFDAQVSVQIMGTKVNDKIVFTATLFVQSDFTTTNPA